MSDTPPPEGFAGLPDSQHGFAGMPDHLRPTSAPLPSPRTAELRCAVCLEVVKTGEQDAHLSSQHPAPIEGFKFFYDARPYFTQQPSMLVGELLTLVGGNVTYLFHEERDGQQIPFAHGNSVDLTREPWFYSVPSATY